MEKIWSHILSAPWWMYIVLVFALAIGIDYFHLWNGLIQLTFLEGVGVVLVLVQITIAGVTIYLHRNQAHSALTFVEFPVPWLVRKALRLKDTVKWSPVAHFFRFWLWLTTGMLTKEWTAIHRKHHAKVETEDDPHSPKIYGIRRLLFAGVLLYVNETHNKETIERYGRGTPDDWIERNVYTPHKKLGVVLMLLVNVILFGPIIGIFVIWLVQMAWIPFWAAGVVNGVGHYFGYRNYPSRMSPNALSEADRKMNRCIDEIVRNSRLSPLQRQDYLASKKLSPEDWSKNIVPWAFWIGGEELHNNHHAYPTSAKFSAKWFEFDIGWIYIRILEMLGLAKVKYAYGRTKGPFDT